MLVFDWCFGFMLFLRDTNNQISSQFEMQIKFFDEQVVVESPVLLASMSNNRTHCTNVTAMMQPMIRNWSASGPSRARSQ